jgi:hypothetical protein
MISIAPADHQTWTLNDAVNKIRQVFSLFTSVDQTENKTTFRWH